MSSQEASVWERLGLLDRGEKSSARGAIASVARQIAGGEAAHAWLLLGPPGSGKRSVALAMAAGLDCPRLPGIGCGECSTCARILRRRHPDVHHLGPEGPLIPVDVIRESVIPEAARSPFEGSTKVFVIEEADRMNPQAQNALLKTLEEPHADTVFVLISDEEDELLETIRSRCRVVRLDGVPEARIATLVERQGASEKEARSFARISEGDLERALALEGDAGTRSRRELWLSVPARLSSPADALDAAAEIVDAARAAVKEHTALQKEEIAELAEAMGEGRGTGAARTALATRHKRELRRAEEELLGDSLRTLGSFYRDVLAVRSDASETVVNEDVLDVLKIWAQSGSTDGALLMAAERCVEARAALLRNANPTLAIEAALCRLATLVPPPAEMS